MNLQVIKIRILSWLKKIILYGLYFILSFFLLGFGILQIPQVQETIIGYYTKRFSAVSGFDITFKSIYLIWYDRIQIEGLLIKDPEQNKMIDAGEIHVNFELTSLLSNNEVNIDVASINSTYVNLIKIPDSDSIKNLNINIFISRLSKGGGGGGSSPKVNIGEIIVNRSGFSYDDTDKDSLRNQFDYNHFSLKLDDGQFQNFKVIGDTIQFNVNSLYAQDQATQFDIKQLTTFFRISQRSMEFLNINLKAGNSIIRDTVLFKYESQADLSDFTNKVDINAHLNSEIEPTDLALFAPGVEQIKHTLKIEGDFSGKVNHFTFKNMLLESGKTLLTGNLSMDGLPQINETFIDLKLRRGNININDLSFLFPETTFQRIKPLGTFDMEGNFTGFVNDFVANGVFAGEFGRIRSDVNLKINAANAELSEYKGNLQLQDFKLGTYIGDTSLFKTLSLKGNINGRGFTEKTADFFLNGVISHFGIGQYDYTNISTKARFRSQFFNGTISIQDPNLKFNAEGSIDFRDNNDLVKIKAKLDTAVLHNLGLTKEKFFLRSNMDINTKGLKIDSLFGEAKLNNTLIVYKDESLEIDTIQVISTQLVNGRSLVLKSSLADIDLSGNYFYSSLFNDLNNLYSEFYLTIKNNKSALEDYYDQKRKSTQEYDADFKIKLHDINPLISVAGLDLALSKNTLIEGRFSNGFTSIFSAYTAVDSLTYAGKLFTENDIEFNGSKIRDSTNILAMLTFNSRNQSISKTFNTKDLIMEAIWNKDHIETGIDFNQVGYENYVRLKAAIDFLNDSTRIKILPSQIKAIDKIWQVSPQNFTLTNGEEWSIHHLALNNATQQILVEGDISRNPQKALQLKVTNFDLSFLNTISEENFYGILNGSAEARDLYANPYIQNDLTVSDLTINDFLIGNITGVNTWNQADRRFDINFSIDRLSTRIVDIKGYYNPGEADPLHVTAQFEKANIKIAEPLLKDLFSNMDGTLTGNYSITGTFTAPKIKGEGDIAKGQIMINYLKAHYSFNGTFGMTPTQFVFKNFRLSDIYNNTSTLEGYIAHRNFDEFRLNLDASFTNFQLLNTTAKDNSLFYGQGYATGNANILGPASNLKISATARTEKNTRIYLPMSSSESTEKKDFLNFIHFTDTAYVTENTSNETRVKKQASTFAMDLNLDITPDAYTEIIFDIKSGDIIRGRGNGDIKLQIDTKGEFYMFGAVEFTQGAYNFTLYDIINKEFDIQPGSRISWYGNPYEGVMDITATYKQMASLAPIISDQTVVSDPQVRRKYPTEVKLKMEGQMLSPRISFDIDAKELPDNIIVDGRPVRLDFEFKSFKARLDEQELKRQVFSLVILRRFSPPDAFSTSGTLYNSVSELLSNQLSYWLTQVDQNLEIDLDLGTLDQEAFNTFQLRLSYSFLNGRLRVTRDGTISNQYKPSDNISTIAGDWTVDYLLTPDGKFKVKMYSRSNYNQISNTLGTQTAVTTGVSLLHTQNFNKLKDLWKSARDKKEKELNDASLNEEATKEEEDGGH